MGLWVYPGGYRPVSAESTLAGRDCPVKAYMDVAGKKVVVLGLARSGVAAARLLSRLGATVVANDRREAAELAADLESLSGLPNVTVITGGHPEEILESPTALVVKNPGIPQEIPVVKRARALGIPVISEVELAYWHLKIPVMAITGTNGKTTTTALAGEMFKAGGMRTQVAGNIGLPLSSVVEVADSLDVAVAELSSFQLEDTLTFRPRVAAILNITPDHMDRHHTMEQYIEAKARIFVNQKEDDALVLNADDPVAFSLREKSPSRVFLFSRKILVENGAFVRDGKIVLRKDGREETVCGTGEIALPGAHNLENALAAALVAFLGGVPVTAIAGTLKSFAGVAHRLERVCSIKGVNFYNDSKGTNTDATRKALEAFSVPIVLIAGGYDKGGTFADLAESMHGRVKKAVLMGQVRERLAAALAEKRIPWIYADSLESAVATAFQAAAPGDVVLLSPACASWDMFSNYEERGDRFKAAVRKLKEDTDGQTC